MDKRVEKKVFSAGSKVWKTFRSKHITGTEISSLFALNKYLSAAKVMRTKDVPEPLDDNIYLRAGRLFEPSVLVALDEVGIKCEPAAPHNKVCVLASGNMSVSLDAIDPGGKYLVECKTSINESKVQQWSENKLAASYIMQVHAGLMLSELDYGYIACLGIMPPFDLHVFKIEKNEEINKLMIDTAARFWDNKSKGKRFIINQHDKQKIKQLLPTTVSRYEQKV